MKKLFFLIPTLLIVQFIFGQYKNDAVRYSLENVQGSARFQALSGAFGALGGDLSAVGINPAGSAVFTESEMTFTTTNFDMENTTSYFDASTTNNFSDLDANQLGVVFVIKNDDKNSKWKKFALTINYDVTNYLNEQFLAEGTTNTTSVADYFLNYADGLRYGDIIPLVGESISDAYINIGSELGFAHQQAFLGNQIGIIRPSDDSDPDNIQYNRVAPLTTLDQRYELYSEGYNTKLTFNLASQYTDKFYFGVSANVHNILYERIILFNEEGYDPAATPLNWMRFDNLLRTEGNGFSFQLGTINKITPNIRVGLSYQSPIWYTLTEELSQEANSNLAFPALVQNINLTTSRIVNVFPDYNVQTPSKINGSIAYIFGKNGLLSFDYSRQDFSNLKLKPESDPNFQAENALISEELKALNTYRLGGEFRVQKLSLRGGYQIQESPYKNEDTIALTGYSAGIGYKFGGTQIDISYNQSERTSNHQLFETGLTSAAQINRTNKNITVSLTYKL